MWLGPAEHENETVIGQMNKNWDIENGEAFEDQVQLLCKRPIFLGNGLFKRFCWRREQLYFGNLNSLLGTC
jgi:hypothetical protein